MTEKQFKNKKKANFLSGHDVGECFDTHSETDIVMQLHRPMMLEITRLQILYIDEVGGAKRISNSLCGGSVFYIEEKLFSYY